MSDTAQSDVLVFFQLEGESKAIEAESQTELNKDDTLLEGFSPGRFFQADNFSFGMSLADDEGDNIMNPNESRSYGRWRGLKFNQAKPEPPFQAEPEDITLTRMIDSSSPVLLRMCLDFRPFDRVVVAKRARVGKSGLFFTLIRLEFKLVWIKSIDWEDDDAVKETIKFKFNEVQGQYVKRKPNTSVDTTWPFRWKSLAKAG